MKSPDWEVWRVLRTEPGSVTCERQTKIRYRGPRPMTLLDSLIGGVLMTAPIPVSRVGPFFIRNGIVYAWVRSTFRQEA